MPRVNIFLEDNWKLFSISIPEAERGDAFLRKVFEMAGAELALHVKALLPNMSQVISNSVLS